MKFSLALSTLAIALPLLIDARATPSDELQARQFGFGGRQRNGNNFGAGGKNQFGGAQGGSNNAKGNGNNNANNNEGGNTNQGNNGNNNAGGNKGGAASSTAAAAATSSVAVAAASTASAAAAASSSAAATGQAIVGAGNVNAAQTSLTLDPAVVMKGLEQDGQAQQEAGQVASLTSSNNFINFCLTQNLPLTNGQQVTTGSCNQTPMGVIVAQDKMPSSKFVFPTNGAVIAPNTEFTITMAVANMETGNFVNAQSNYFAAPQQVNAQGLLVAHSHVVVEALSSDTQTTPTDPTVFAFFKGLNAAAVNGQLTADVTAGLPAGSYRLASINTAANHQPALVPIAQHGSVDDQVYFTVSGSASASNSTANAGNAGDAGAASASVAASTSAAAASASAKTGTSNTGKGNTGTGASGGKAQGGNNSNTKGGQQQQQQQPQRGGNNNSNNSKGGQQQQQQQQPQRGGNNNNNNNRGGRGRRAASSRNA